MTALSRLREYLTGAGMLLSVGGLAMMFTIIFAGSGIVLLFAGMVLLVLAVILAGISGVAVPQLKRPRMRRALPITGQFR